MRHHLLVIDPFEIEPIDVTISDLDPKAAFPFGTIRCDRARDDFASSQLPHHALLIFQGEFDDVRGPEVSQAVDGDQQQQPEDHEQGYRDAGGASPDENVAGGEDVFE
ncbi:MAG: hypothetical protein E8D41_13915 [Nitrospira sp.]|nr:MAG: hypothetical protein E8D41_13915 [Nitrospira sp.]